MNKDERIEMYKEIYNSQIDRKDNLKSKLFFPSGILVLFMTLANYLFQVFEKAPGGLIDLLFLVSFTIFIIKILISLYYIYNSWKGYDYAYLPKAKEIECFYHKKDDDEAFKDFLIKKYTKSIDINFQNNKNLRTNLFKIQKNLIQALIFAIISVFLINIDMFYNYLVNIESIISF